MGCGINRTNLTEMLDKFQQFFSKNSEYLLIFSSVVSGFYGNVIANSFSEKLTINWNDHESFSSKFYFLYFTFFSIFRKLFR